MMRISKIQNNNDVFFEQKHKLFILLQCFPNIVENREEEIPCTNKQQTKELIESIIKSVPPLKDYDVSELELREVLFQEGQSCKERVICMDEYPAILEQMWPCNTINGDNASNTSSDKKLVKTGVDRLFERLNIYDSDEKTSFYKFVLRPVSTTVYRTLTNRKSALNPFSGYKANNKHLSKLFSFKKDKDHQDLCNLPELNETTLLNNLKRRLENNQIYTYIGSILISINPFHYFPIYNPKFVQMYQARKLHELPPHIFAIADAAYQNMMASKLNQCIVISGESGSGKTENANFLLHHLSALSQRGFYSHGIEKNISGVGPVLEAFGNAKTIHNDNSSRFGKFVQVSYKEDGTVHGAVVEKYLLEMSRIVSQPANERNYHVFYYLLAGATPLRQTNLHLSSPEDYYYLNQQDHKEPQRCMEKETKEFDRLRSAMYAVGFSNEEQERLYTVLSAILHLGNIQFRKRTESNHHDEYVAVKNMKEVSIVCSLIKVSEEALLEALMKRKTMAGGEVVVMSNKLEEVVSTCNTTAKCLYSALFNWIVLQINAILLSRHDGKKHQGKCIGVLDIFGFEDFQHNSFEQFCINYANENLHFYFNQHIFKLEQEEYNKEGIVWRNIEYIDNTACLDLFNKKPSGLLHLLDEESNFPGATNETLLSKFHNSHKKNACYEVPQLKESAFSIVHYAGKVKYQVQEFREKNIDLMRTDVMLMLKNSKLLFIRELIGQNPVAIIRWSMLRLMVRVCWAFKRAGLRHQERQGTVPYSKNPHQGVVRQHHKRSFDNYNRKNRLYKPRINLAKRLQEINKGEVPIKLPLCIKTSKSKNKPPSTSAQFHNSLLQLTETLNQATPFFIRCIKSNVDKIAKRFDEEFVQRQLRYTGMLATVKIRQSGYNYRSLFTDFISYYHLLLPEGKLSTKESIETYLNSLQIDTNNFQIGKTKVFLRENEKLYLDEMLHEALMTRVLVLQRWMKARITRSTFLKVKQSAIVIQAFLRSFMAQRDFSRLRGACLTIQCWFRMATVRRHYLAFSSHATVLQRCSRSFLVKRRSRKESLPVEDVDNGSNDDEVVCRRQRRTVKENNPPQMKDERVPQMTENEQISLLSPTRSSLVISNHRIINALSSFDKGANEIDDIGGNVKVDTNRGYTGSLVSIRTNNNDVVKESKMKDEDCSVRRKSLDNPCNLIYLDYVNNKHSPMSIEAENNNEVSRKTNEDLNSYKRKQKNMDEDSLLIKEKTKSWKIKINAFEDLDKVQDKLNDNTNNHKNNNNTQNNSNINNKKTNQIDLSIRDDGYLNESAHLDVYENEVDDRLSSLATTLTTADLSFATSPCLPKATRGLHRSDPHTSTILIPHQSPIKMVHIHASQVDKEDNNQLKKDKSFTNNLIVPTNNDASFSTKTKVPSNKVDSSLSKLGVQDSSEKDNSQRNNSPTSDVTHTNKDNPASFTTPPRVIHIPIRFESHQIDPTKITTSQITTKLAHDISITSPVDDVVNDNTIPDCTKSGRDVIDEGTELVDVPPTKRKTSSVSSQPGPEDIELKVNSVVENVEIGNVGGMLEWSEAFVEKNMRAPLAVEESFNDLVVTDELPLNSLDYEVKLVSIDEDEEAEKVNIMDLLQQNIQQNNNHQNDNELKENDHKNYNTTKNLGFFNHNPDPKKAICQKGLSKSKKIKLKSTKHTDVMGNKDSSDDQWTNKMVEYFSGRDDRDDSKSLFKSNKSKLTPRKNSVKKGSNLQSSQDPSWTVSSTAQWKYPLDLVVENIKQLQQLEHYLSQKVIYTDKLKKERGNKDSVVDEVFKATLHEFHANIVTQISTAKKATETEYAYSYERLMKLAEEILKAKTRHCNEVLDNTVLINPFRGFLDEFMRKKENKELTEIKMKKRHRNNKKKEITFNYMEHQFILIQFNIATFCEFCSSKLWVLEKGYTCKICKFTIHKKCASKLTSKCTGMTDDVALAARLGHSVIGCPLNVLMQTSPEGYKIHPMVERLINTIEMEGLYTEGLYRKNGKGSDVKQLVAEVNSGVQSIEFSNWYIHVLTSVFKAFFRDMPEPLMTFPLYQDFLRTTDIESKEERREAMYLLVEKLPQVNRDFLERLIFHLAKIALQGNSNLMTAENLSVIFSPGILRNSQVLPMQESLLHIPRQTSCVQFLIEMQMEKTRSTLITIQLINQDTMDVSHKLQDLSDEGAVRKPISVEDLKRENSPVQPDDASKKNQLTHQYHSLQKKKQQLTEDMLRLSYTKRSYSDVRVSSEEVDSMMDDGDDDVDSLATYNSACERSSFISVDTMSVN